MPVDPTVDDPSPIADASSGDAGDAEGGGAPSTPASAGVWSCETTTFGPFSSMAICEAGRDTACDAPRSDVVEGKPCANLEERHRSCGACNTKHSFNARTCVCR